MRTLTNKNEIKELYKNMKKGDIFYKCSLATFWANDVDFEFVGYAMTDDIEKAKEMFMEELEDDEDATINAYMVIWAVEYVGEFIGENGKKCFGKGYKSNAIINDFGTWKTFKQFCEE